jgi:hypothetical protein
MMRTVLLVLMLCLALLSTETMAQIKGLELTHKELMDISHGPKLSDGLFLLEQWHEKPSHIRDLYAQAFALFEADQMATYAVVMANPRIQAICAEHGITHIGGPMLGDVTPGSVTLWLRTVNPGEIEVRVKIDGVDGYGLCSRTGERLSTLRSRQGVRD